MGRRPPSGISRRRSNSDKRTGWILWESLSTVTLASAYWTLPVRWRDIQSVNA